MGSSIVDIRNMGDALRNTGYKNIESAVSEIIDNSVEAESKNIFIILREGISENSGRKVVTEIGFLDNGKGMPNEILGNCLGIGSSTRQARRGIGRFGVGLPQSSLYACPKIEVYSWQNGVENSKKVYLDIDKIKDGSQTEIEDPIFEKIPTPYSEYIKYKTLKESFDFSESGTLVIWRNCDRLTPKTRGPLTDRLDFALGQKFRYFIHNGQVQIKIICDENRDAAINVLPNDPLFLMEDNRFLCDPSNPKQIYKNGEKEGLETPFELYTAEGTGTGEEELTVNYIKKDGSIGKSNVLIRFSTVKTKFYDRTAFEDGANPGTYPFGKYAAKLEGVSVIRAGREIDFRKFDFYNNINEPQHRWWGCEIIFNPELDETFGVSNNKQYVELKKEDVNDLDFNEVEIKPIWDQLSSIVVPTIKNMYAQNLVRRKNTRPGTGNDASTVSVGIINDVENNPENLDLEINLNDNQNLPEETHTREEEANVGKAELKNIGVENPTDEEGIAFVNNSINFVYSSLGARMPAFDYKPIFQTTIITINTDHKFYTSFLQKINSNPEVNTTFELFLASILKTISDLDRYQQEQNDRLVASWQNRLNQYILKQLNPRD